MPNETSKSALRDRFFSGTHLKFHFSIYFIKFEFFFHFHAFMQFENGLKIRDSINQFICHRNGNTDDECDIRIEKLCTKCHTLKWQCDK